MRLLIIRQFKNSKDNTVIGELYINNVYQNYTLENETKMIPEGTYIMEMNYSQRFKKVLPLLIVKGRTGIRIHAGNKSEDSRGCILVGNKRNQENNMVYNSRITLSKLMEELQNQNQLTITIKNNYL